MKRYKLLLLPLMVLGLLGTQVNTFNNQVIPHEVPEIKEAFNDSTYYASATGTGSTLKNNLTAIITKNTGSYSYSKLWTTYKEIDVRDDGYIQDIYSDATNFRPGTDQAGNYSKEGDAYNREHTIPQSWWKGGTSNQGSDPLIVYPSDGYVNGKRGNHPFGETSNPTYSSKNSFSLVGPSSIDGYSGTVFEPNDRWKGDMARVYFYALTRWSGAHNWTSSGGNAVFSGSTSRNYGLTDYAKNLFLKWHEEDPVDDWEFERNQGVYDIYNCRNPYIDHPEFVADIWGTYGGGGSTETLPTSVSISPSSPSVKVGSTLKLTATVSPSNASNKNVTWSSSSTSVATVSSSGIVTGLKAGTTTITATCVGDTSVKKSVTLTVTESSSGDEPGGDTPITGESFKITFEHFGFDDGTAYTNSTILDSITSGREYVSSATNVAKIFPGSLGLKFGSSSVSGTATFILSEAVSVESIVIEAANYKAGYDATLTINDEQVTLNSTSLSEYTIEFNSGSAAISSIEISSLERSYIKSITVVASESSGGGGSSGDDPITTVPVTGVNFSEEEIVMNPGDITVLEYKVLPENATNKNVTFDMMDNDIITLTGNSIKANKVGEIDVYIYTEDGSFYDSVYIKVEEEVVNVPVTGVNFKNEKITLAVGDTTTLQYEVLPANATNKNVSFDVMENNIISLNSNDVTALNPGEIDVYIYTEEGSFFDFITIIVEQGQPDPSIPGGTTTEPSITEDPTTSGGSITEPSIPEDPTTTTPTTPDTSTSQPGGETPNPSNQDNTPLVVTLCVLGSVSLGLAGLSVYLLIKRKRSIK